MLVPEIVAVAIAPTGALGQGGCIAVSHAGETRRHPSHGLKVLSVQAIDVL